ncbi:AAA family ATPase [Tuanshanicoccus lijuaniae]|uniref:AAA family ATPase n=1 Tax=Aerococcaceae bacterium zg-1292 TaxID=2774330 RepID=UPI001BD8BDCF|nr:ATP-binding protein [Aerococcaceae bacterium zg-A91]MBS4458458.1 ATP-binding protein [Aerococcaceae bacterium zg-BR33]
MYEEIIQIIKGGIERNPQKVFNFSKKLADHLEVEGNKTFSRKINKLLTEKDMRSVTFNTLQSKPYDKDSHLEIVDVKVSAQGQFNDTDLFFSDSVENEILSFIQSYKKKDCLIQNGISFNNNLLLYGPPGTGKTSIANYISQETGLTLVTAKLDSLVSSLLGSTAKNIRKLFEYVDQQPCILFLDEFDILAKHRDDSNELAELKRVVNSLLQNIDAFSQNNILIAVTNTPALLDDAIWRRFDTKINISLSNDKIRRDLLVEFLKSFPNDFMSNEKNIAVLVFITESYSPSDIKILVNSAFKKAIIKEKTSISFTDLLYEILIFRNSGNIEIEKAVKYLRNYHVTQKDIAETLNISVRQVRNHLEEVKHE